MIDHLLTFANETAAHALLDPLGFGSDDNWDRSRVDPGVKLITADAVWDNSDPENPVLVTPQEVVSGFHVTIALPDASTVLDGLPGPVLRVAENRGKANKNAKFHEYAEPTANMPEGIAADTAVEHVNRNAGKVDNMNFRISPRFLGSDYPDPI